MLLIGAHMSIAGGLDSAIDRAVYCKNNCLQIFTHSPRVWAARTISEEEVAAFKKKRSRAKLKHVVVHAPYLPNLASPDNNLWHKSIDTIVHYLTVADAIRADHYVIHPGSSKGRGADYGIKRIIEALDKIFNRHTPRFTFLLETTAGAGSVVGSKFHELAEIIEPVKKAHP